jgi:predicted negative regulator of RcsB-dependent stress response
VEIYHEIGDRFHEAGSDIGLGDAQLHAGDPAAARKNWEQALAILESIPHPDAEQARTRLNQLISADESPAEAPAAQATGVPSA